MNSFAFPEASPGDSSRYVAGALLRYELSYKLGPSLRIAGGLDARSDTHRQVERGFGLSWQDRSVRRPALAVRRLSGTWVKGKLTAEVGKQFVRWGKADILNPTDRFAPRDYLNVVETDFLPITAARVTYGGQADSIDLVWSPRFTPSRTPLFGERWAALPQELVLHDRGARIPGGQQAGARWNHIGRKVEYAVSFYEGYNHLPLIDAALVPALPPRVFIAREYPKLRMYGLDGAVPFGPVTVKGEVAYFGSSSRKADEYALYVLQVERQAGEWFFVGGYAGETVTNRRSRFNFSPDRGFTRAFLGRAGYTIDTNRSVALDVAARQNGNGSWMRLEYSQALGANLRATGGFTWIRGDPADFLAQYRRNSHARVLLRYSF
ncbi:MAG: hypothetical protein EXQ52_18270 [Bryobacterales bacterium]|nr:hypothetical protein [Bryobacterales bacterium]